MESVKTTCTESHSLRANKLALVERLADDLAHEIKNPLHSMVINLEVLRRRLQRMSGEGTEEHLRYVEILSTELDRVSRRVDLMLRLVRPERDSSPITLSEAVDDLLELVELERERYQVDILVRPASTAQRVRLPAEAAHQLVLNLLLMAIDAAEPGGVVEVASGVTAGGECLHLMARRDPERERPGDSGVAELETPAESVRRLLSPIDGRLTMDVSDGTEGVAAVFTVVVPLDSA